MFGSGSDLESCTPAADALGTLVGVRNAPRQHAGPDARVTSIGDRLREPKLQTEFERLHSEMVEALTPAAEGPIVNPGRRRSGRLLFGDATE